MVCTHRTFLALSCNQVRDAVVVQMFCHPSAASSMDFAHCNLGIRQSRAVYRTEKHITASPNIAPRRAHDFSFQEHDLPMWVLVLAPGTSQRARRKKSSHLAHPIAAQSALFLLSKLERKRVTSRGFFARFCSCAWVCYRNGK